jgi:hypothetical protein
MVTIQLTPDLFDSGVESAHIHLYTARFLLVLEQIRGNLKRYPGTRQETENLFFINPVTQYTNGIIPR